MIRTDFVERFRGSRLRWIAILLAVVVSACTSVGDGDEPDQPGAQQAAPPVQATHNAPSPAAQQPLRADPQPIDHESAPRTDVVITWRDGRIMAGTLLGESQLLWVDLANSLDRTVTGRLVLLTGGLDGRSVRRPLQNFSLPAGMSREISLPVSKLPIQSEVSTSYAVVIAEVDRPNRTLRVSTQPIYYRFQNGYREAKFYSVQEAGKLADRGLATKDPMDVQGRIIEENGSITNAADAAARAAQEAMAAGKGRQGLTQFGRARIDPTTRAIVHPFPLKPAPAPTTQSLAAPIPGVNVCGKWLTDFIDIGWGEDFLTESNTFEPAMYAQAWIIDGSGNAYWSGNLNSQGCTGTLQLNTGTYYLYQVTTGIGRDNKWFNSYFVDDGDLTTTYIEPSFTVSSGTTTVTAFGWYNDSAINAAVVAAQVLERDAAEPGGMGITQNWPFDLRTNEGCGAGVDPPTDSCYKSPSVLPPNGAVQIGTTPVNGFTDDKWKFTIGHEIGHFLSDIAMGMPQHLGWEGDSTAPLCTCNHYDTSWGNKHHCMQSHEFTGSAQFEGLAHLFGARAFNRTSDSDAIFVYYKPFRLVENTEPFWPPVDIDAFNPQQWRNSHCPSTVAHGVEMDWMVFFYDVTQGSWSDVTPVEDLYSVYRRACTGDPSAKCSNHAVSWTTLRNSASVQYGASSAKFLRFDATGLNTGVAD